MMLRHDTAPGCFGLLTTFSPEDVTCNQCEHRFACESSALALAEQVRQEIDVDDVIRVVEARRAQKKERSDKIEERERKRAKELSKVRTLTIQQIDEINNARVSSNAKKQMKMLYENGIDGKMLQKMAILKRNPYEKLQRPYHLFLAFKQLVESQKIVRSELIASLRSDDKMSLKTAYAKQAVAIQTLLAVGAIKKSSVEGEFKLACVK